ncbi:SixA phosphatase family protein [Pseudogemmobacter sp. W21_MBD1_M6]|jgi:phosphohistidine phosphatase|uniref:SixA phosphatase family protein n=1 Tax=Pseudogemmobacter sp. W21_MBD1_M6 TaxID=3240271 RepID=UPI003F96B9EA
MTHRLILTRHAKSSWDSPAQDDKTRPLNTRGIFAAKELGDWLASRNYTPTEVLCSSATRTKETWDGVAPALTGKAKVTYNDNMYNASADVLLAVLQKAGTKTVMMIGHNPGIASFAEMIAADPPLGPVFSHFPTAATLVLEFDLNDWSEVKYGTGQTLDFVTPDDLGVA